MRISSPRILALCFTPMFICNLRPANVCAQSFNVLDVGTPTGTGIYSEAHGISALGAACGEWQSSTNAVNQRAFLYSNGTNADLAPTQGINLIAYSVNRSNHVVGEAGFAFTHAFLYTNGVITDLGTLGTGTYSVAWAINDFDQIVGESLNANGPFAQDHGVWWHDGTKTDLGVLATGDYSSARGINASNAIVGEASIVSAGVTNVVAFLYTNGVMRNLGTLPGGNYSSARAINEAGDIVGEASVSNGDTHAFLYQNGVMSDLGTFGGNGSSASAINNSGQIVGYALDASGKSRAFLYSGSGMLDLNDHIPSSLVCTSLVSADGINNRGQIAASGFTGTGTYHAFLLTPGTFLTLPTMLPDGEFRVTVNGAAGQQFVLEGCANLPNWIPVSTNILTTNSLDCTDKSAVTNRYKFYRARLL